MHEYEYERPALAVDAIVIRQYDDLPAQVLLVRRGIEPFKYKWAFPGGHVEKYERPEVACVRELFEETGVKVPVENLSNVFCLKGHEGRDPRGWVVSATYQVWLEGADRFQDLIFGDDADSVRWFDVDALPPLAFDHGETFDDWWIR